MSENRHTPGPWNWMGKSEPIIFSTQDREEEKESVDICECFDITGDEQIANARLIAAAPDLLEACKAQHEAMDRLFALLISKSEGYFPSKSGQPWEAIQQGNVAIIKAEKES